MTYSTTVYNKFYKYNQFFEHFNAFFLVLLALARNPSVNDNISQTTRALFQSLTQFVNNPLWRVGQLRYRAVQHSAAQYCIVQCRAVLCSGVQCRTVKCSAVQYCVLQCRAVGAQSSAVQNCVMQCRAVGVQSSAVQQCALQCSAVVCFTEGGSTVQCSAVQYCEVQCSVVWCQAMSPFSPDISKILQCG